jgi:drug/metabolite transporter (DMT)-like permease
VNARWAGVATLLAIAVLFASNHVAARLAFDHGASVATAVAVRSAGTALAVGALLRMQRTSLALPAPTLARALAIGFALSLQSFCLYSAVARLPVALALLTFNTFPILLAALSWATGGERPAVRTLVAMPVILLGLALALDAFDVVATPPAAPGDADRFAAGVAYALGASASFAVTLVLIARWLGPVDGRVRTFWTMAAVAAVVTVAAAPTGGFSWPGDATGWVGLASLTVLYGLAITSLFVVLPRLGAVNNSPVLNVEPIASMVLAWVILDQRIAALQVAGALLVVGSIVWMSTGRR